MKEIDNDKAFKLTESFTCLLNIDFFRVKGVIDLPDEGYEDHKEIRNKIFSKHKEGVILEDILKECLRDI